MMEYLNEQLCHLVISRSSGPIHSAVFELGGGLLFSHFELIFSNKI